MSDKDPNERPTIAERYSTALAAGSTRIAARASSGDVVLAAALQGNRLGAALLRLQAEYDGVRVNLERAGAIKARNVEHARELLKRAQEYERKARDAEREHLGVEAAVFMRQAQRLHAEALAVPKRTPDEVKSSRVFILIELKTLTEAKQRVGALALAMSEKRKRPIEPELVLKLAGQVLDVFLDPNCHECDGTGKSGSAYLGEVERQCRVCKGVGHRRDIIGRGVSEVTFAAVLLGELQRQVSAAARGMVVALSAEQRIHSEADATDDVQAALEQLAHRLADLRSEEADRDDVVEKLPADDIAAPES